MSAAGTGELWFIEGNMDSNIYCDIMKQKMMPHLQKLFSNITTPNTPPRWHCLADEADPYSPDLNPIERMWGILKWKMEKHHVSNIQLLCDVTTEEEEDASNNMCSSSEFHAQED